MFEALISLLILTADPAALPTAVSTEASSAAKPIPQTREQMKDALERLKHRQPRLPLPALEDDPKNPKANLMKVVNNGRMRFTYLPEAWFAADFKPDPAMTLDNTFKVRLFWLVSRANNCQYCLGHQEHKLSAAGMTEPQIAALDSEWSLFPVNEQSALAFTRKLTERPHEVSPADIKSLQSHFSANEVVEIAFTASFFNNVNRWTDGLGIPQDEFFRGTPIHFDTAVAPSFQDRITTAISLMAAERPPLESWAETVVKLSAVEHRSPLVPMPERASVAAVLAPADFGNTIPGWAAMLTVFPQTAKQVLTAVQAIENTGDLTSELKQKLFWVCARENRAWATAEMARRKLHLSGISDAHLQQIDNRSTSLTAAEQAAFDLARKLTTAPQSIADRDIALLRNHYSDRQVAQIVYVVCTANMLDRFSEVLQLSVAEKE